MYEFLKDLVLPEQYQENVLNIGYGMDTFPELIDCFKYGYSVKKYEKLSFLYRIEEIKRVLKEALEEGLSKDEQKQGKAYVDELIKQYNNIVET